jgi:hypothetical protein
MRRRHSEERDRQDDKVAVEERVNTNTEEGHHDVDTDLDDVEEGGMDVSTTSHE